MFDKDRSGFVGKGQIKYILTNLGEKMSEEEVDELFKSTIDASNDEVDYRGESYHHTPMICFNQRLEWGWYFERVGLMQDRICQDDRGELGLRG